MATISVTHASPGATFSGNRTPKNEAATKIASLMTPEGDTKPLLAAEEILDIFGDESTTFHSNVQHLESFAASEGLDVTSLVEYLFKPETRRIFDTSNEAKAVQQGEKKGFVTSAIVAALHTQGAKLRLMASEHGFKLSIKPSDAKWRTATGHCSRQGADPFVVESFPAKFSSEQVQLKKAQFYIVLTAQHREGLYNYLSDINDSEFLPEHKDALLADLDSRQGILNLFETTSANETVKMNLLVEGAMWNAKIIGSHGGVFELGWDNSNGFPSLGGGAAAKAVNTPKSPPMRTRPDRAPTSTPDTLGSELCKSVYAQKPKGLVAAAFTLATTSVNMAQLSELLGNMISIVGGKIKLTKGCDTPTTVTFLEKSVPDIDALGLTEPQMTELALCFQSAILQTFPRSKGFPALEKDYPAGSFYTVPGIPLWSHYADGNICIGLNSDAKPDVESGVLIVNPRNGDGFLVESPRVKQSGGGAKKTPRPSTPRGHAGGYSKAAAFGGKHKSKPAASGGKPKANGGKPKSPQTKWSKAATKGTVSTSSPVRKARDPPPVPKEIKVPPRSLFQSGQIAIYTDAGCLHNIAVPQVVKLLSDKGLKLSAEDEALCKDPEMHDECGGIAIHAAGKSVHVFYGILVDEEEPEFQALKACFDEMTEAHAKVKAEAAAEAAKAAGLKAAIEEKKAAVRALKAKADEKATKKAAELKTAVAKKKAAMRAKKKEAPPPVKEEADWEEVGADKAIQNFAIEKLKALVPDPDDESWIDETTATLVLDYQETLSADTQVPKDLTKIIEAKVTEAFDACADLGADE